MMTRLSNRKRVENHQEQTFIFLGRLETYRNLNRSRVKKIQKKKILSEIQKIDWDGYWGTPVKAEKPAIWELRHHHKR